LGDGSSERAGVRVDGSGEETVKAPASRAVNFGTVSVGTTSAKKTLTYIFTTAGTIDKPLVLTQGAQGLDFADTKKGTCDTNGASHRYGEGQTCTIIVTFKPAKAGTRYGAVEMRNGDGSVIGTGYIYGTGKGPEVVFNRLFTLTELGGGGTFQFPEAVAVDASGNIYVTDQSNSNQVTEMPAGCASSSCVRNLGGGLGSVFGVAVDGSGNVYVTDNANGELKEMPAGCASSACVTTLNSSFYFPLAVAVDASDNLYVVDQSSGPLKMMPAGCALSSCIKTLGGGFLYPRGVAVDGSGNVYVADTGNQAVKKVPAGCSSAACVTTLGGGFDQPLGVALDGTGNVYVADGDGGAVDEIPAGCTTSACVITLLNFFHVPENLAVDGSGNVYVSDTGDTPGTVLEFNRATSPSLTFATTDVGETSTDSPQTVTLQNIGNASLDFSAITYPTDFPEEPSAPATECSTTDALNAAAECTLTIDFTPTFGDIHGRSTLLRESVSLTDNDLNVGNAKQSVSVEGTGELTLRKTQTITFPAIPSQYLGTQLTLSATASSGLPVSFASTTTSVCTVSGTTASLIHIGTCTIQATQAGNSVYAPAPAISQSFSVILRKI
jgi:sugar lactone lactonase YvrE